TSKYLQEQVVTDRNGRYVLVVRSEHRSAIPGIVHVASASGASLFLEPLTTVDVNNDIVALEEQEAEEVRRILLALTDNFRGRPGICPPNTGTGFRSCRRCLPTSATSSRFRQARPSSPRISRTPCRWTALLGFRRWYSSTRWAQARILWKAERSASR